MPTDLIFTALARAARNDTLVELFLDPIQPNHFVVGLVSGRPVGGVVVFINISPDHQPSGIYMYKLSSIVKVALNTRYLAQVKNRISQPADSNVQTLQPIVVKRGGLPKAFQRKSGRTRPITIQAGKVGTIPFTLSGYLVALDKTCLCLAQLDSDGNEDGLVICRKKYIDAIDSSPRIMRKPPISGAP